MTIRTLILALLFSVFLSACTGDKETDNQRVVSEPETTEEAVPALQVTAVTGERIRNAADEAGNWLSHGRTYDERRYSPLTGINKDNVAELGLAWYYDVPTKRGMEASPIVVDGRMYVSGSWSIVYALDAATGEELWTHDPAVQKSWSQYACCDAVNRGVAVWGDKVYVGTLDGYLVAIDADTGTEKWRVDTIDRKPPYTITGAPRIVNGLVIIGNGGAEYGVRGYVSAYDAETGEMRWRFYTVPGNPADGFENEAMKAAAETWTGEWWQYGGGGTVWDSMAYDPELDLLYVGTGNGSPWNRKIRSPEGGDNLYLSSIVALRPGSGEYVWHYQTTPGETWDFTATQQLILADVDIDGSERKVIMQAPKNGFFYVLDRSNGELISAEAYVDVNWASGIDKESGRPIETPNARYVDGPAVIQPAPFGGHNWHSMAYSEKSGLVFVPTQQFPYVHADDEDFVFEAGQWNTGTDFEVLASPDDPAVLAELAPLYRGQLVAWDPVAQKEVWRYQHAGPWNGGVLATAADLVFQGSLIGEFAAYDADNGKRLWVFPAQTGVAAAPVSYVADGSQHVSVAVGWGTALALLGGDGTAALKLRNISRILAFRVGGEAALPALPEVTPKTLAEPPQMDATPEQLAVGRDLYFERCWACHGADAVSGGVLPDLRYITPDKRAIWDEIVLNGALQPAGMPGFGQILSKKDSAAIHAYVLERTRLAWEQQQ